MNSLKVDNKLRGIIVDDELHGRENLKMIFENYCPEINVLDTAESVKEAKKLVGLHSPDVVFLDINMPVLDGFDFLAEYDELNFMVVFVSAHEEYGIKAVKAGAVDYLLKPINIKELKQTIKKLLSIKNKKQVNDTYYEKGKLIIPSTYGYTVLLTDDIIRLEADSSYTKLYLKDGKSKIVSRTLKDFEEIIPAENFFRVHKSHIINLKYIRDYSHLDGYSVTLTDGSKVELSRRKAPEFIQKIKVIMKSV